MDQLATQWLANVHQVLDNILTDAEDEPDLLRAARGAVTRRRALRQMIAVAHRAEALIEAGEMPRRAEEFGDRYAGLIAQ